METPFDGYKGTNMAAYGHRKSNDTSSYPILHFGIVLSTFFPTTSLEIAVNKGV